jgi:hypothetical protein
MSGASHVRRFRLYFISLQGEKIALFSLSFALSENGRRTLSATEPLTLAAAATYVDKNIKQLNQQQRQQTTTLTTALLTQQLSNSFFSSPVRNINKTIELYSSFYFLIKENTC